MEDIMTISKTRKLVPSMDYELLRREGMKHIEELASDLWTDYNVHDPGITILEALCYAITELGYRCQFDMKDLLTSPNGEFVSGQNFFTAKQILTVNPVTINDYRKLLVDLLNVQNAWLIADDSKKVNGISQPVNEVPLYLNCPDDKLDPHPNQSPVFVSGLYRVLLSLEHHDLFGDLNDGDIVKGNPALPGNYFENEFYFSIELPAWKKADFDFAEKARDKNNIESAVLTPAGDGWRCKVKITGVAADLDLGVTIPKQPASGKLRDADAQAMFNDKEWLSQLFALYSDKIILARSIVRKAIKTLHEHRNLCEDFIEVTTIDSEQVAFCFDVDVKPESDIEKIQAEIFFIIENYLNPPVHFYTLKELLSKKIPVDEIFNGPILEHGFIDTEQLKSANLRDDIRASDIINLLMDIEGVIAVRNFQMTKYGEDGNPVPGFKNIKWCMCVTPLHKPVLRSDRSKILLFKNEFPFIARYDEVKDTVRLLHAASAANKLTGLQDDLFIPKGAKRDTESHWPIQYDLPATYGVGEAGLSQQVTSQRKGQQRQLKAYLMFYEQLVADFFKQLSNAHELFSTNNLTHTYYAQFLQGIDEMDNIYIMNAGTAKIGALINNADSTSVVRNEWQELYEPKYLFEERRSRFLDHLLARFAESFNDYALMMYTINYEEQTEEKVSFNDITNAKINTLKNYAEISSNRGKAFNYLPQIEQVSNGIPDFLPDATKYWDTDNVSGLEKKISALTGINDSRRRFLYCIKNTEITCTEKEIEKDGNKIIKCFHSFTMTSRSGVAMVSKDFESKKDAEEARDKFLDEGTDPGKYEVFKDGRFKIKLGTIVTASKEFDTKQAAQNAIKEFASELTGSCNDPVGLHLIEHILLRPRTASFDLLEVCLDDCDCPCENDPYSFKASVVLPYWPGHFDNVGFRRYFENKIREEAPAHVMLKVCWLSNELMRDFETRYKTWIEMLAAYAADKTGNEASFELANNSMIDILRQLHSEYPQATLHNCDESEEGSNTVVLNKTVLGTFKT